MEKVNQNILSLAIIIADTHYMLIINKNTFNEKVLLKTTLFKRILKKNSKFLHALAKVRNLKFENANVLKMEKKLQ